MDVGDWLDEVQAPLDAPGPDHVAELRAALDEGLSSAVDDLVAGVDPLRMSKSRLADLGRCERSAVARAVEGPIAAGASQLAGVALDAFVQHQLFVGRVLQPASDLRSMLAAAGEWDHVLALDELDDDAFEDRLGALAASVAHGWASIDPRWTPRTQQQATLRFVGGRVVVSGRTDVELGGLDTGLPGVVVEVKSGAPAAEHQGEVHLYALLCALRDGVAPAAVARWYPGSPPAATPVSVGVLESAARRVLDGTRRWAQLSAGGAPTEAPGVWCAWCPDRPRCPSAAQVGAPEPERTGLS